MKFDKNKRLINWLRIIALTEGVSFLLILFVTMPLKYIWGNPVPNLYVGYSHGFLFILYVATVLVVAYMLKWKLRPLFISLLASIVPFGTFWADKKIFIPAYQTVVGK